VAPERWRDVAAALAIFLLGLVVFGGAVRADFTFWDDDIYVTRNPLIEELSLASIGRVFTSFSNCNYHPLTYVTYMVENATVGRSPWLYHLDNVLLHGAAAVLAYFLGRRWLASRGAAWLAALLFLVHPLRVESVAWVSERKDLLCAVFYLAALLVHPDPAPEGRRRLRLAAALLLFLAALLSKVMAVSLPAVLVVRHWARREPLRPRLLELAPFIALTGLFAVLGILAQAADGAVTELHGGNVPRHLLSLPKALAFYSGKLLWPLRLSPRYFLPPAGGILEPGVLAGLALAAGAIATVFLARSGRPGVAFGLGFFLVTWAPVSGLVPSSTLVADRYLYLPALGLFWALAGFLAGEARNACGRRALPAALGLLALGASLVPLAWLAAARVEVWRDGETLWRDALLENPRNAFAHNQLALSCAVSGRFEEALEHNIRAVELGLDEPKYLFNICRAQRGLGEGEKELANAREIVKGAPDFLPAWLVVARHLCGQGRFEECERLLERLERQWGGDPGLLAARGDLEGARGRTGEALALYLRALERETRDPEIFLGAAEALARRGDGERALLAAERAAGVPDGIWYPDLLARREAVLRELEAAGGPAAASRLRALRASMEKRPSAKASR
jgi:tetratricopeptide (TPR) repeat protein